MKDEILILKIFNKTLEKNIEVIGSLNICHKVKILILKL